MRPAKSLCCERGLVAAGIIWVPNLAISARLYCYKGSNFMDSVQFGRLPRTRHVAKQDLKVWSLKGISYIDNFNLFWGRGHLVRGRWPPPKQIWNWCTNGPFFFFAAKDKTLQPQCQHVVNQLEEQSPNPLSPSWDLLIKWRGWLTQINSPPPTVASTSSASTPNPGTFCNANLADNKND